MPVEREQSSDARLFKSSEEYVSTGVIPPCSSVSAVADLGSLVPRELRLPTERGRRFIIFSLCGDMLLLQNSRRDYTLRLPDV